MPLLQANQWSGAFFDFVQVQKRIVLERLPERVFLYSEIKSGLKLWSFLLFTLEAALNNDNPARH